MFHNMFVNDIVIQEEVVATFVDGKFTIAGLGNVLAD